MWPRGSGQIQTSVHAGGIASAADPVQGRVVGDPLPVLLVEAEAAPAAPRRMPGPEQSTLRVRGIGGEEVPRPRAAKPPRRRGAEGQVHRCGGGWAAAGRVALRRARRVPRRRSASLRGSFASTPATVRVLTRDGDERVPETGAVQSVQEAEVTLPAHERELLWKPETLERLARAYWAYVTRLFLRLVRVVYEPDSTTVVVLSRRLPLLRFGAPSYETAEDGSGGSVTWPIERGLLVAREGRNEGQLRIRVRRVPESRPRARRRPRPRRRPQLLPVAPRPRPLRPIRHLDLFAHPARDARRRLQRLFALARGSRPSRGAAGARTRPRPAARGSRGTPVSAAAAGPGRIVVAGANGFIGRRLVAALRRRGAEVRALVRDRDRAVAALGPAVELAVADVETGAGLEEALEGCEPRLLPRAPDGGRERRLRPARAGERAELRERRKRRRGAQGQLPRRARRQLAAPGVPSADGGGAGGRGAAADPLPGRDDRRPRQRVLRAAARDRRAAARGAGTELAREPNAADRRPRRDRLPRGLARRRGRVGAARFRSGARRCSATAR